MAGLLFYGWRAGLSLLVVLAVAALGVGAWRRIGARGRQLHLVHSLWMALLLAMMLPAHLAGIGPDGALSLWPILPAAGLTLVILLWTLGGIGAGRIHPVLVTYLLLTTLFSDPLTPHRLLRRGRLGIGDLNASPSSAVTGMSDGPWLDRPKVLAGEVFWTEPASQALSDYTLGRPAGDRSLLSFQTLLRDALPPLEDIVLGAHPGPIGASSAIAVLVGGLFLLYRGLIDFRIPLIIVLTMLVMLLILPVPIVITDKPVYSAFAWRDSSVGWPRAITFINYELLAGPALFMACFLATSPSIRPMSTRARWIYGSLIGALTAVFQLYVAVSFGAYLALLIASLVTPTFDKWFRPQPLI